MSEVSVIALPYRLDFGTYYEKLSDLPGFVLLESTDKIRGRYDIVSAYPYASIHDFETLLEQNRAGGQNLDLPFQGGAIGYFSYDLACSLLNINHKAKSLVPLPLMAIGLYDWAIIVDHQLQKVTLFAANTEKDTKVIVKEILKRWQSKPLKKNDFSLKTPFKALIPKADYREAFDAIHHDLKRGRCYQVNYTQPFYSEYSGDAWAMYRMIRAYNRVPYSAYLAYDQAKILSFSPERFLCMQDGFLLTSPIKGTQRRAADKDEDARLQASLEACTKNRAENVMIVDLSRNDLGKIAKVGSVEVQALCAVESYARVHHLVSHIRAESRQGLSPLQAFRACFPGGSITGAPKLEAMRVIGELEPYLRGVYCGSMGYISRHGRMDLNIAIRTITADTNTLFISAGGGLVIDSKWEEEYAECLMKVEAIFQALMLPQSPT